MKKQLTIGSIESFTGGAFAAHITSKAGASKYYRGTVVTYATDLKAKLGVDTSNGVINAQVALEMAKYGKEFLGVDACVAFTGNAGPGTMENKPKGLVYIAINENVFELKLDGDRKTVVKKAIEFAEEKLNLEKYWK